MKARLSHPGPLHSSACAPAIATCSCSTPSPAGCPPSRRRRCLPPARACSAGPAHVGHPLLLPLRSLASIWWRSSGPSGRSSMSVRLPLPVASGRRLRATPRRSRPVPTNSHARVLPRPTHPPTHLNPTLPTDYKALKDLIKEAAEEAATAGVQGFSPRTTSLTVQRAADRRDSGARPGAAGEAGMGQGRRRHCSRSRRARRSGLFIIPPPLGLLLPAPNRRSRGALLPAAGGPGGEVRRLHRAPGGRAARAAQGAAGPRGEPARRRRRGAARRAAGGAACWAALVHRSDCRRRRRCGARAEAAAPRALTGTLPHARCAAVARCRRRRPRPWATSSCSWRSTST